MKITWCHSPSLITVWPSYSFRTPLLDASMSSTRSVPVGERAICPQDQYPRVAIIPDQTFVEVVLTHASNVYFVRTGFCPSITMKSSSSNLNARFRTPSNTIVGQDESWHSPLVRDGFSPSLNSCTPLPSSNGNQYTASVGSSFACPGIWRSGANNW